MNKFNPGPAAGGWCVFDGDLWEEDVYREVAHGWFYVGDKNTNNEAEYPG